MTQESLSADLENASLRDIAKAIPSMSQEDLEKYLSEYSDLLTILTAAEANHDEQLKKEDVVSIIESSSFVRIPLLGAFAIGVLAPFVSPLVIPALWAASAANGFRLRKNRNERAKSHQEALQDLQNAIATIRTHLEKRRLDSAE